MSGDVYNYNWSGSQWVPQTGSSTGSTSIGATLVNPSSLPSDGSANSRGDIIADLKGRLITFLGTALDSTNDSVKAIAGASATVGGTATYLNTALSNTVVSVKASAGNVYGYFIENPSGAKGYVQMFDVAAASVTLGTTTPKFPITVLTGGVSDAQMSVPVTFSTAISIAATTTATGNTAPATAFIATFFYL